jgi:hypothetical protein
MPRGPGRKHLKRESVVRREPAQPPRRLYPRYFYERTDDIPERPYRWWWNQDPQDVFDTISEEELRVRIKAANSLNIPVIDHLPEDDHEAYGPPT